MLNLGKRLGSLKQDPWKDLAKVKQKLPEGGPRASAGDRPVITKINWAFQRIRLFIVDYRHRAK